MNKEDLKLLGIPEDTPDDKFLETFNGTYIKREDVLKDETLTGKIVGKRMGSLQTLILKYAEKDHSFALGEDKKPKPIEELIPLIFEEQKNKIKEIEIKSNLTAEDRVKQAEEKVKSIETERNNYKTKLGEITGEYEKIKTESAQNLDNVLLKYKLTEHKSKIPLIPDITDLQRKGYESELNDNYRFEFDETKEKIIPKDKSGNLINSKKSGGFADVDEVLTMVADAGGILKKNNAQPINNRIDQNNPAPQNGRQIRDLSGINKGG